MVTLSQVSASPAGINPRLVKGALLCQTGTSEVPVHATGWRTSLGLSTSQLSLIILQALFLTRITLLLRLSFH